MKAVVASKKNGNIKKKRNMKTKTKKIDKIESILFQARKNIIKGTKAVKGFLIQKVTRKINELKSSLDDNQYNDKKNGINNSNNSSISKELEVEIEKLSIIKAIDFKKLGDNITDSKFNDKSNNNSNIIEDDKNVLMKKYYDIIRNHKKINDIISEFKIKYENENKHKEEMMLKRKEKNEKLLKKSKKLNNKMNLGSLSQGVFLDNLNDDDKIDKNDKNDSSNKQKIDRKVQRPRKEIPLSPYMPSNRDAIKDTSDLRQTRKPKNYEDDINSDPFPEKKRKYLNDNKKFSKSRDTSSSYYKDNNSMSKMNNKNDNTSNENKRKERSKPVKDHDASDLKDLTVSGRNWKQSGVHPSWAAKQINKSQQPAIVESKGKKTVFED
jgi:hypothetical protein